MSKRCLEKAINSSTKSKQPKHFSLGLVKSMKDPDSIVKQTKNVVVIRDKYPKAKIHYLVLPHDNINSIYELNNSHISLLNEFKELLDELCLEHKDLELKAGFHAVPSMQRMHMHIISKDMISRCLKTKIHWNSFTTDFFLPFQDVLKELKETGSIKKMSAELHKSLMAVPLKCHQCNYLPKSMPQLKDHLLTHENK